MLPLLELVQGNRALAVCAGLLFTAGLVFVQRFVKQPRATEVMAEFLGSRTATILALVAILILQAAAVSISGHVAALTAILFALAILVAWWQPFLGSASGIYRERTATGLLRRNRVSGR